FDFFVSFDDLPNNADIYIVSLKNGSKIYSCFVDFMRKNTKSKFIFLNEFTETLSDEDFDIRDESNAYPKMYTPGGALELIKESIDPTKI
ncbi:MAG: hypothetical protein LBQ61_09920, partial [Spirochaetales bacterium]|nr:hypothetical protein [Spirochaetales bacterium]